MPQDKNKPNIVIIMTDHQALDSLACYGFDRHSPATDRLAGEGVCFTHASTTTVMCGPVRCAMQSGFFPNYLGVPNNRWGSGKVRTQLLPPNSGVRTIPSYMKEAGYLCGFVGKLHMSGNPPDYGYDDYLNVTMRGGKSGNKLVEPRPFRDYLAEKGAKDIGCLRVDQAERGVHYNRRGEWHAMSGRLLDYGPDHTGVAYLFAEGSRMIETYAKTGQPFLVQVHTYQAPHWPYIVPEPYASMYDPRDIPERPNFRDPLDHHPLSHKMVRNAWLTQDQPWARWAESISKYYGLCSLIEDQAVLLLDQLDRLGISENTMVIWVADHGAANGAHGIFDKDLRMIDEVYRIPMIVRWPGGDIGRGVTCEQMVQNLDILPTLMEIAGLDIPEDLHGQSMLPALCGDVRDPEGDFAFWSCGGDPFSLATVRAIRTRRYKYVYNAYDINEFYDLEEDPAELTNLIDDPKAHAEIARLKRMLWRQMEKTDDAFLGFARQELLDENGLIPPRHLKEQKDWTVTLTGWAGDHPEMALSNALAWSIVPGR